MPHQCATAMPDSRRIAFARPLNTTRDFLLFVSPIGQGMRPAEMPMIFTSPRTSSVTVEPYLMGYAAWRYVLAIAK